MTSCPPRWTKASSQPDIFTRWSTDWAWPLVEAEPVDGAGGVGGGDRDADALDPGGLPRPEVQSEVTLVLERRVEHDLRGHDPASADLVRRPVGQEGDLVALRLEAEGELEAGLVSPTTSILRI